MVDLYKQLKSCRWGTISHYAWPALLRVVDSLHHNHQYRVTLREFLVNWATMTVPIVKPNVCFEDSFKVHNIHIKLSKKYVCDNIPCDNIPCGMVSGILRAFDRSVACSFKL